MPDRVQRMLYGDVVAQGHTALKPLCRGLSVRKTVSLPGEIQTQMQGYNIKRGFIKKNSKDIENTREDKATEIIKQKQGDRTTHKNTRSQQTINN